ncbi:sulfatase [Rubrobacter aplysinae]|uniref:sulfatase n=1 Tax=Rubrobacter aplysinae TaxID=909625 RepID=UPI00064C0306|nr:sulfatase [Rubrobacter aplysinae]
MNVVVVILDSLRRDHVGAYGNEWIKTPSLDALAEDSLRFTRPYPESIPTICARRAIHTGRRTWPFRGWTPPPGEPFSPAGWRKIPEDQTTLADVLSENGYETALITDTFHQFKPSYNFQQGFDVFEQVRGQAVDAYKVPLVPERRVENHAVPGNAAGTRDSIRQYLANIPEDRDEDGYFAPRVFSRAMDYLETAKDSDRPFYLMIDNFDPHEPWDTPARYSNMYGEPIEGYEPIFPEPGRSDYLSERELERMRALYSGEVTMTDEWFGKLVDRMEDLGLMRDTLMIVLSDHGVGVGEHGYVSKVPEALWPEITDIVYYVRHPEGKGAGRTSSFYASTHDVAPTVLSALGIERPGQMNGQDLTPILEGGPPEMERPHFSLGYHNYSWCRDENYAMFCLNDGSEAKLYDLREDPEMHDDVSTGNRDIVRRMYEDYIVADAGGEPPPLY